MRGIYVVVDLRRLSDVVSTSLRGVLSGIYLSLDVVCLAHAQWRVQFLFAVAIFVCMKIYIYVNFVLLFRARFVKVLIVIYHP